MSTNLLSEDNYCIALQPICDNKMRHVADEILYRSNEQATFAQIDDHLMATARVVNAAFLEKTIKVKQLNAPS